MKRSTLGLALLLAGLALYIYRFEREPVETIQSTPIFDVDEESIVAVELQTEAEAELIRFERVEATNNSDTSTTTANEPEWRLSQPVAALADPTEIELIVDNILSISFERIVTQTPSREPEELSVFGLDTPTRRVHVYLGSGEELGVEFGSRTPTDRSQYARRLGSSDILAVPAYTLSNFDKTSWDLRDKHVFRFAGEQTIERFDYQSLESLDSGGWVLEKIDPTWRVTKPFDALADRYGASALATRVRELRMTSVIVESATASDLEEFGLNPPGKRFRIRLMDEDDPLELSIGQRHDNGYVAKTSTSRLVFLIEKDFVEKELSRPPEDFVSLKLLDMSVLEIRKVELEWNGKRFGAEKNADGDDDSHWQSLKESGPRLSPKSVEDFLYRVNGLSGGSLLVESDLSKATHKGRIEVWRDPESEPDSVTLFLTVDALLAKRDDDPFTLRLDPSAWETLDSLLPFAPLVPVAPMSRD